MFEISPTNLFWMMAIPLFIPLIIYKSFFLKMAILAYAYPVWLMSAYSFGVPVTRIMSNIGNNTYNMYYSEAFIWAFLSYLAFLTAIWEVRNNEYSFKKVKLNFIARILLFIVFILFVSVAYPKALGLADHRFGSLGGIVVFIASLLIITSSKITKYDFITKLLFVFILFLVIRGERVDFILTLVTIFIFYKGSSKINIEKFLIISLMVLFLAVISGILRANNDIDLILLLENIPIIITNFGTAVDVIHVYLTSVSYYHNEGVNFDPVLNIFYSYIPFFGERGVSSELNFTYILRSYVRNLGGGLFYSVGMMFAGGIGVILMGYIYGYIYKRLFKLDGLLSVIFISFFILQFRLQWYGLTYYSTSLIVGILFYFMINASKRRKLYGR